MPPRTGQVAAAAASASATSRQFGVVPGLKRLFAINDESEINSEPIKARLITTSLTALLVLSYLIGTLGVEMAVDSFSGPESL